MSGNKYSEDSKYASNNSDQFIHSIKSKKSDNTDLDITFSKNINNSETFDRLSKPKTIKDTTEDTNKSKDKTAANKNVFKYYQ
jgi:hypothetical protein